MIITSRALQASRPPGAGARASYQARSLRSVPRGRARGIDPSVCNFGAHAFALESRTENKNMRRSRVPRRTESLFRAACASPPGAAWIDGPAFQATEGLESRGPVQSERAAGVGSLARPHLQTWG